MRLKSLIFRDTFEVRADYEKLAAYFKTQLDDKYFKGYIDRDETQLFFYSGALKQSLRPRLPIIQLNIDNKVNNEGKIKIKFKIVDFALILFALANAPIVFFSIINVNHGSNSIPPEIPPIIFILSYGFLLIMYMVERSGFKKEIEHLELRQ